MQDESTGEKLHLVPLVLNSDIEDTYHKCNEFLLLFDNLVAAPLQPWLAPKQPWERIHIDHATWDGDHSHWW